MGYILYGYGVCGFRAALESEGVGMTTVDWVVIAAGVALIVWVLWFFFLAEQGAATATAGTGGVQDVSVRVHGGYEPATIRVKAGVPVRLHFDRQETSSCSEE